MNKKRLLLGSLGFAMFILGLFVIIQPIVVDKAKVNTQKLIVGRTNDSITLDPAIASDMESFQVTVNIYETLVKYEKTGGAVLPGLAEKWKVSEDGLTWTFKIRQGVKFHDGTVLNAEAVAFNFHRWMDSDSPYHIGQFSYWSYSFGGFPGIVKSVTALSDETLEIILNEPYAPFLSAISMPAFGIASPDAVIKYNENISRHPIGTGPFEFKEWQKNNALTLERNEKYWGNKAKVDEVVFKVIPSTADKITMLKDEELHIVDYLDESEIDAIKNEPTLNIFYRPVFNIGYLALNNTIYPFDQKNVREAISLLIDKEVMADTIFSPLSRPAHSFLPPVIMGYHEGLKSPEVDVLKAKKLLTAAGFPNGFKTTLWVMDRKRNYYSDPIALAMFIQSQLSKANIVVDLKIMPWDSYIDEIKQGIHPMALVGWNGDIIDPDNFLYNFFASEVKKPGIGFNYSFYKNETVDRLLIQARRVTDAEFRKNLYRELQEIIQKDVVSVPLVHTMTAVGTSSTIRGFEPHITGIESLDTVEHIDD